LVKVELLKVALRVAITISRPFLLAAVTFVVEVYRFKAGVLTDTISNPMFRTRIAVIPVPLVFRIVAKVVAVAVSNLTLRATRHAVKSVPTILRIVALPVTNKVSFQRWIALHCTVASIPLVLRRVASPVTVSVSYPTRHASPYTVASVPCQICSVARLITNAIFKPKVQAPRFTVPSIPPVLRIVAWRITIIVFNPRRKTYWLAFISVLVRLADWPAVASVKLSFFNVAGRVARAVSDPVRWAGRHTLREFSIT